MPNNPNRSSDRSNRRAKQRREELLEQILAESSDPKLNYGAKLPGSRQALEDHSKLLDLIGQLREEEADLNTKLPERSEAKWASFFKWISAELEIKTSINDYVDVVNVSRIHGASFSDDDQECALVTKKAFKAGEVICSINRSVMLSNETLCEDEDLTNFIVDDPVASEMRNVILVLHLLNEYSKNDKSRWAPYLAILPSKILPVLKLDEDKFKFLLASSHIFDALKMIRSIARQYSYFYKLLLKTNLPIKNDFTYDYYCWGVSTVCSRQNDLPDSGGRPMHFTSTLIPILDMCNHDRKSNQAIFNTNQSKLIATKDLNVNDEITINYGPRRSSGEFYIHNGFVPDDVLMDSVPLALTLNDDENLKILKTKLLKTLNMPPFGRFRLVRNAHENRHRRDPHLTMFLIVYLMTKEETEFVMDSENPVGVADQLYEFVQYKVDEGHADGDEGATMTEVLKRLSRSVTEYLSKRASIIIALIDRTLNDSELTDKDIAKLLEHEKSLYESYLIQTPDSSRLASVS